MSSAIKAVLLATTVVAIFPGTQAIAADMPIYKAAPAPEVEAWNPWMIRLRALAVLTRDSGTVDIPGVAIANPVPGSVLKTNDTVVPEIDISYFFNPNIALELVLGVTPHTVDGKDQLNGLPVGKTWLLPPTLTLQYHFTNFGAFKPYIGGGVNYTIFFNTSAANSPAVVPLTAGLGATLAVTGLDVKNTWAPAAQVGFDYMLTKNVGLNVDVKKLWLRPDWSGSISVANGTPLPMHGKVDLDPWLVSGGVTYKF